uniref:Col_cuticle_N domain-containing protein n=1 Tax=Globodera pallida TaxID=36090 RepID=A0A183C2P2_GLOPA
MGQLRILLALFLIVASLIGQANCQGDFWASMSQPLISMGSDAQMPLKDFGMDFSKMNDYSALFGGRRKRGIKQRLMQRFSPKSERFCALLAGATSVLVICICGINVKWLVDDICELQQNIETEMAEVRVINRESWDGMMDLQHKHSQANGISWLKMQNSRRKRHERQEKNDYQPEEFVSDEVARLAHKTVLQTKLELVAFGAPLDLQALLDRQALADFRPSPANPVLTVIPAMMAKLVLLDLQGVWAHVVKRGRMDSRDRRDAAAQKGKPGRPGRKGEDGQPGPCGQIGQAGQRGPTGTPGKMGLQGEASLNMAKMFNKQTKLGRRTWACWNRCKILSVSAWLNNGI